MCGRTAQTQSLVRLAAQNLGYSKSNPQSNSERTEKNQTLKTDGHPNDDTPFKFKNVVNTKTTNSNVTKDLSSESDNYNLCPGMEATVFFKKDGQVCVEPKTWGLITKHGTKRNPLPGGKAPHFSALMYNARSETLYLKSSFSNLISKQRSCLVAVDGWFEWKQEIKGKKQPYFIKTRIDNKQNYCLFPGLWTEVATGRDEDPILTTFTILTTEATPNLSWLHSRMPVCCWSKDLATKWLGCPMQTIHEALLSENSKFSSSLEWYPVTTDMTNLAFRSSKAIAPLKRESIESFFIAKSPKSPRPKLPITANTESEVCNHFDLDKTLNRRTKIDFSTKISSPTLAKQPAEENEQCKKKARIQKGSIASFFSPKK
mmetsp:Transcript_27595/g.40749  ORF Transcript_27595/g.40749 Transcript_27595/m.40749 type:complete len:373 (+) Transcript_27595:224-1342(+)